MATAAVMEEIDDEADSTSMIGRRLGRYTCLRSLGAGGMAVLYLARRTGAEGFTKVFALKRVKPQYAANASFTRMFMREAKLSATLDHPNIAQVVDFGQDGKEHFLVMEYVHGPDLRRLLRVSEGGRLPLACGLAILTRVCAGLHYAHEKSDADGAPLGLVHRDVSPTNVLLSLDGAVKLTDFGIAKAFGSKVSGTSSGMLVGKPGYMSPEQVRTETLDRRSDVFCLGVLLYEVTTGHRCFFGDNVFETLNASQRAAVVPPKERVNDYPDELAEIVKKALEAKPEDRYPSARALQLALEEFALERKIRTSDSVLCEYLQALDLDMEDPKDAPLLDVPSGSVIRDAGGTAFMVSGSDPEPSRPEPEPKRSRAALWVGTGVALGALSIAAVLAIRPGVDAVRPEGEPAGAVPPPAGGASPPAAAAGDVSAPATVLAGEAPAASPIATPSDAAHVSTAPAEPAAHASPRKRAKKRRRKKKGRNKLDILAPPSRRD